MHICFNAAEIGTQLSRPQKEMLLQNCVARPNRNFVNIF